MTEMPLSQSSELDRVYQEFQDELSVYRLRGQHSDLITTFNGNKTRPVHRWFTFKEGFSAILVPWIVKQLGVSRRQQISFLDPFCGVGTSLLSAQLTSELQLRNLVGIEVNPFIAWVAQAKLNWHSYDVGRIENLVDQLSSAASSRGRFAPELPSLSTLNNPDYYPPEQLNDILYARDLIRASVSPPEQDFFLLGWSAVIEAASNLRKDGRALRLVANREKKDVATLLRERWLFMLRDLQAVRTYFAKQTLPRIVPATILRGDGRRTSGLRPDQANYDLILYSPPYPNNIDYSEVYKLELWLHGFVKSQEEFRELRLNTMRSHPSVRFEDSNLLESLGCESRAMKLVGTLLQTIPHDDDFVWRDRLFRGYAEDMLVALRSQYRLLRTGGYTVCVVGNSVHGNSAFKFCVAADLIIAVLAQEVGFKIDKLIISREFVRRKYRNPLSRESILVLRK